MNQRVNKPYVLYDPCCGSAYLLTSLGYIHMEKVSKIYASDIDENVISLAQKNLSLLSQEGLNERIMQIENMLADYGRISHVEALKSAKNLQSLLNKTARCIEAECFIADITKDKDLISKCKEINILITDLPYGEIVSWSDMQSEDEAIEKLLNNVYPGLAMNSAVAIVSRKKTKIKHEKYKRIELFVLGKRQVTILQPTF